MNTKAMVVKVLAGLVLVTGTAGESMELRAGEKTTVTAKSKKDYTTAKKDAKATDAGQSISLDKVPKAVKKTILNQPDAKWVTPARRKTCLKIKKEKIKGRTVYTAEWGPWDSGFINVYKIDSTGKVLGRSRKKATDSDNDAKDRTIKDEKARAARAVKTQGTHCQLIGFIPGKDGVSGVLKVHTWGREGENRKPRKKLQFKCDKKTDVILERFKTKRIRIDEKTGKRTVTGGRYVEKGTIADLKKHVKAKKSATVTYKVNSRKVLGVVLHGAEYLRR